MTSAIEEISTDGAVAEKGMTKSETINPMAVEKAVLDRLGRAKDLYRVDVKPLFGSRFRVNVWREVQKKVGGPNCESGCGVLLPVEAASLITAKSITDSFYVVYAQDGFVSATPEIKRKY